MYITCHTKSYQLRIVAENYHINRRSKWKTILTTSNIRKNASPFDVNIIYDVTGQISLLIHKRTI